MEMVDIWIDTILKDNNVKDLRDLPVRIIKNEISDYKGMLITEEAHYAAGSEFAQENMRNIKEYIKILKGVLKL